MNTESYKKLITLNNEFQKVLRQIVDAEGVDEKNWPLQVLGHKGIAEWRLLSAYIDWYIEMYDEIDEFYHYDGLLVPAVNDFLERYNKDKENFDILTTTIAFDYMLGLLGESRFQTLERIEDRLLKKDVDEVKEEEDEEEPSFESIRKKIKTHIKQKEKEIVSLEEDEE
jgi:hypothetical protein